MDMSELRMVEKKFFLGRGQILIGVSQDFHVEDLGKMGRRTRSAVAVGTTGGCREACTSDEVRNGVSG